MAALSKAATIGAPQGNWTPLPTGTNGFSLDPMDWPLTKLLHVLLGNAKKTPEGGYALEDPANAIGILGTTAPAAKALESRAVEALTKRYPMTAATIEKYGAAGKLPEPLGNLAATLKTTREAGVYGLKSSVEERLARMFIAGEKMPSTANWAGAQADELIQAFGGDKARALQWARLWGATSPNTSVPVNTRESIAALIHALENPGVPLTNESARVLEPVKITMAGSKVPNINRTALFGAIETDQSREP